MTGPFLKRKQEPKGFPRITPAIRFISRHRLSFPNIGNRVVFLERTQSCSSLALTMASAPIAYVPSLKEWLDFLSKASDTVISDLVDSNSELWTCLPQDYLRELGALDRTSSIPKIRIDLVVAYIRKHQMLPPDRRSDKGLLGLPTNLNSVSPGPLSRKPSGFLFPL